MKFKVNINSLSDIDLERYKDFIFNKLLAVIQSEEDRLSLFNRIDMIEEEQRNRR
jgi:hypothetical protein